MSREETYSPGLDESFLNALYNGLTEAVLAVDLNTRRIVYWNKGAEVMFGYPAQEALGRTTEFLYPDYASFQRVYEIGAPVIREQGYYHAEWEYRRRNGSLFPAEAAATRFLWTEGGEDYFVYVIRDITERKRAEEELRRERNFAESLIETTPATVLVLDTEGRIVCFNPYMEEISGYRLQEVQGKDWFTTFLPERDRSRIRELFSKVESGTETRGVNPIVTKEGHEREIEWSSTTLKDASGDVIGVLSIGQDITERKRVEAWLQSLIDATQDAVISIDHQGRIVLFNPAAEQIFGYTQAEVQRQKVNMLMPEPYASEHDGYIDRYEQTREPHAIGRVRALQARRKNGEVFPIEILVTEVKADEEVRYAAFLRDISEKVWLQEQLVERERLAAIGTTAAKLAHEVGNPLNGMYMAAQLLERRLAKHRDLLGDRIDSPMRNLMSEIGRLRSLLEEFRSLSRRPQLGLQPTSLATVVADVLAAETQHYAARGIRVEHAVPPDLPLIIADGEKLKQVLLNLCKNAAEAMPQGGTLTVWARSFGERVSLEVIDTGVGIPAGVNIFEPFTTTKSEGTGLGLAIVRQIVAAHGGTITYTSEPGKGTEFYLTLPLSPSSKE